MMRKLMALAAAVVFGFTVLAAPAADARDRRDGYYERDHRDYDRRRHYRHHDDDDDGDAIAAGAVGLVLGLAIGSLVSQSREPETRCRDNYQRCAPPQGYDRGYRDQGYYDDRSAYEQDYGYDQRSAPCTRRYWDNREGRYVDVPC